MCIQKVCSTHHLQHVNSENASIGLGIAETEGDNPSGNGDRLCHCGDALHEDGTLKDASKMEWLHFPSDKLNCSLVSQHEDDVSDLEWPQLPSSPSEYHSSFESGNKQKSKELNESRSKDNETQQPKVS